MPINRRQDTKGCYYQYGDSGAKYYYKCGNEVERQYAYKKARAQEIAIGEFNTPSTLINLRKILTNNKTK